METIVKRPRGRPRKNPIQQPNIIQPATVQTNNEIINQQQNKPMPESTNYVTAEQLKIRDLESKVEKLQRELQEANTNAESLKSRSSNTDAEWRKKYDELNAELLKKNKYIEELEGDIEDLNNDTDNDSYTIADLRQKLEDAQKHNTEIEAQKTGKLIIPVNDFTRKCYISWCEMYSKDPRWSENYKKNAAQFEKWDMAPDVLNMPILMCLANMLGKISNIAFDCQLPREVVAKIAKDCLAEK